MYPFRLEDTDVVRFPIPVLDPLVKVVSAFTLKNVDKTAALEYIIAGESANFTFIVPTDF